MVRRPLRLILHIAAASALVLLGFAAMEGYLLQREQAGRDQLAEPLMGALLVPAAATDHALRPGAVWQSRDGDGHEVRIQINSLGLRGPEPVVPKPPGLLRVVVLGDEQVFAPQLSEAKTLVRHLEQRLAMATRRHVEVINAGVPGYCPLLSLLQFRHDLLGLQPDLVILNFDATDVADDRVYRPQLVLDEHDRCLYCPHPLLAGGSDPVDGASALRQFASGRWLIRRFGSLSGTECLADVWFSDVGAADWSPHVRLGLRPLAELNEIVRGLSARFVLTATPPACAMERPSDLHRFYSILRDFAVKHGVEFCDTEFLFTRPAPPASAVVSSGGLTPAGHAAIADALIRYLSGQSASDAGFGESPVRPVSGEVRVQRASVRSVEVVPR